MKTYLLAMLSVIFSSIADGQATAEVRTYHSELYGRPLYESYQITIQDSLKNGIYKSFFGSGHIEAIGNYKNNERIGIWDFYDRYDEKLYLKYDFEHKQILERHQTNKEKKEGDGFYSAIIPEYEPHSDFHLWLAISDSVSYNPISQKNRPYYMEYIVTINSQGMGKVLFLDVLMEGTKHGLESNEPHRKKEIDDIVIRIIERTTWIPQSINGKHKKTFWILPLNLGL